MSKTTVLNLLAALASASTAAATLVIISEKRGRINTENSIKKYDDFTVPFLKHSSRFSDSTEQVQAYNIDANLVGYELTQPHLTALQRYKLMHAQGEKQKAIVFDWINFIILDGEVTTSNVKVMQELLNAQLTRLQEADLRARFLSSELTNLKLALTQFSSKSKQEQYDWFENYSRSFNETIEEQYSLVIQHLDQSNNSLDDNVAELVKLLPSYAQRTYVMQNVEQIENDLFADTFRINDFAKNKKAIEYALEEAKKDQNQEFNTKFTEINTKFVELVNSNVENVAQEFINEILRNNEIEQVHKDNLELLKTTISATDSIASARNNFDFLIDYVLKHKLVANEKLNSILALESISKYSQLSQHYLDVTFAELNSTLTVADLNQTLDSFKIASKMIAAQFENTNKVIDEFKLFVKANNSKLSHLSKVYELLSLESDLAKLSQENVSDLDKTFVLQTVTKYRTIINKLSNLDSKLAQAYTNLNSIATHYPELISPLELIRFSDEVKGIINSNKQPSAIIKDLEAKLKSVSALIDSRQSYIELQDTIVNKIYIWGPDYQHISVSNYLNPQAEQLASDLINKIDEFMSQYDYSQEKAIKQKYSLREQLRGLQKLQLHFLRTITQAQMREFKNYIAYSLKTLSSQQKAKVDANWVNTEDLFAYLEQLNIETNKITSVKFNPIISTDLQAQIDKYLVALSNFNHAKTQNTALIELAISIDHAQKVFNPSYANPAVYTQAQQNYLDTLNSKFAGFDTDLQPTNEFIKALANNSLSPEQANAIANPVEYISNKDLKVWELLQKNATIEPFNVNNEDNVQAILNAEQVLATLNKLKEQIQQDHATPELFQEDFDRIAQIEQNLIQATQNQDVSPFETANDLTEQANDVLVSINAKLKDGSLLSALEKVKRQINKVYPEATSADQKPLAEQTLRKRWEELHEQASKPTINRFEKATLEANIDALANAITPASKLQQALNDLEAKEKEYNAHEDKRTRVPDAVADDQQVKDLALSQLNAIANAEKIPTVDALNNTLDQINTRQRELELAMTKDQIEALRDKIQAKKVADSATSPDASVADLNAAITSLSDYASQKLAINDLVQAKNSRDLLNNELPLLDKIKEAIDFKQTLKNDPELDSVHSTKDAKAIEDAIHANLPNVTNEPIDTKAKIAQKIDNINKAIAEAKSKNKLRKLVENDLANILTTEDKNLVSLNQVEAEIEQQNNKYQAILNSAPNTYTPEQLAQHEQDLEQKIEELKARKNEILGTYENAKEKALATKAELDKRVKASKDLDPASNFANYEKAVQAFNDELANRANSTVESLKEKEKALTNAYHLDLAHNAYNKYVRFDAEKIQPVAHESFAQVKELAQNFKQFGNDTIAKPLSASQLNDFIGLVDSMQTFNEVQKDIVDLVSEYEKELANSSNAAEDRVVIDQLKDLLSQQNQPVAPYTKAKVDAKREDIIAKLTKIKEEAARRINNKALLREFEGDVDRFRVQPEALEGANSQRVEANQANNEATGQNIELGDSVDPQLSSRVKTVTEAIRNRNQSAKTLDELNAINNQIEAIKQTKAYTNALALQVGEVLNLMENNSNQSSELVRSYIDNHLADLVDSARREYANADITANGETVEQAKAKLQAKLSEKIQQLHAARTNLQEIIHVNELYEQAKRLNDQTNYYSIDGVSGSRNNDIVKVWLRSIVDGAIYSKSQTPAQRNANFEASKAKIEKALEYLKLQKQVSDTIGQWISQRDEDSVKYFATVKDEEKLTKDMWDILPNASENLLPEQIEARKTQLAQKWAENTQIRDKRIQTYEAIESIKDEQAYVNSSEYVVFKRILDERIFELKQQNRSASNSEQLQAIQDQVQRLKQFLPAELDLALKIKQTNEYAHGLVPLNPDIQAKKDELKAEIQASLDQLRLNTPTQDELAARTSALETKKHLLDLHKVRLDVFQRWTQVKAQVEMDEDIATKEKQALVEVLNQFTNDLNAVQFNNNTRLEEFSAISTKYLEGQSETSVPFLHELIRKFADKLDQAQKVLRTNDEVNADDVSNNEIAGIYTRLTQAINAGKDLIENRNGATIQGRQDLIRQMDTLVSELVEAKMNAMNSLKRKAQQLSLQISNPSNDLASLLNDNFNEKAIEDLSNVAFEEGTSTVEIIAKIDSLMIQSILLMPHKWNVFMTLKRANY
ncbi:hypothetical protein [Mycoplasma simbae]|uniref:hypothetical protein n=1 Tax=Mycoplasma simbae TaxID=36744 RepID=UPI0004983605|nr:hypothetical protein [Mycoplasma simbae]